MSDKPITVSLESSGLDLFAHGFVGTPEEHRRVEHEIGVVLELVSMMNQQLLSRRSSPKPELSIAIGAVQCATLRHCIDQIPASGYEALQPIFDAVQAFLREKTTS